MAPTDGFILGFDPGGKGRFGWSVCPLAGGRLQPPTATGLADDAWAALTHAKARIPAGATVLAAGIDAPLFWTRTGVRAVDNLLRRELRVVKDAKRRSGVLALNSLYGACVVQGPLLVSHLVQEPWELSITESHPKALFQLLRAAGTPALLTTVESLIAGLEEHERDATLSAVSAWSSVVKDLPGWRDLCELEPEPMPLFAERVSYWMPMP